MYLVQVYVDSCEMTGLVEEVSGKEIFAAFVVCGMIFYSKLTAHKNVFVGYYLVLFPIRKVYWHYIHDLVIGTIHAYLGRR